MLFPSMKAGHCDRINICFKQHLMSNSYLSQDLPHDLDRIGAVLGFKRLVVVKSNFHPKNFFQII